MKRMPTLLLFCVLAHGAAAGTTDPGPLGPVFFDAGERASIEARRRALLSGATATEADVPGPAARPVARQRRLEGLARRSDGRSVAWFDGERVVDGTRWQGFVVTIQDARVLLVAAAGRRLSLSVGQSIDLDSGQVRDLAPVRIALEGRGGRS